MKATQFVDLRLLASCLAVSLVVGCAGTTDNPTDTDPADSKNDSFLAGGKADNGIISPGTPEAEGVLELVNTASFVELDVDASLDQRAAEHIVNYRLGSDRTPGTSDDKTIDTLQQLDDIYWVGPATVTQLVEYAKRNGYVDDDTKVHGVKVGSDEATGILDMANELDRQTLDDAVSLDSRAAEHIVEYRWGRDGTRGTDDDRTFDSLGELDRVSWVSSRAFGKMLDYAKNNRFVPVDHWRDLFELGYVDVTFTVTDQTCQVEKCYNDSDIGCSERTADDYWGSKPAFRVTGQNPGELTIEYVGDHDSTDKQTTFTSAIAGDGSFRVGYGDGYHHPRTEYEQYFTGQFNTDYEHQVTYHRTFENATHDNEITCTGTWERK
jgi:hypothetical protein